MSWTEAKAYPIVDQRAGLGDAAMARCEKCGSTDAMTHHHRRKRSHQGGHAPSNIVLLCITCHDWVERNAVEGRSLGWVLAPSDDPLVVPIFHHPQMMQVRLDDEGLLVPVDG
jgi:hypothetical protein